MSVGMTVHCILAANIKEVQQILGHKTLRTTEHYVGVFDDTIRAVQSKAASTLMDVALTGKMPERPAAGSPRKLRAAKA